MGFGAFLRAFCIVSFAQMAAPRIERFPSVGRYAGAKAPLAHSACPLLFFCGLPQKCKNQSIFCVDTRRKKWYNTVENKRTSFLICFKDAQYEGNTTATVQGSLREHVTRLVGDFPSRHARLPASRSTRFKSSPRIQGELLWKKSDLPKSTAK